MPTHVDTDAVKRSAREILDKRVDAALRIAQGHQERLDKQEAAAAAERDYAALWAAGLREGWTEAELKAMDLIPPDARPQAARPGAAADALRVRTVQARRRLPRRPVVVTRAAARAASSRPRGCVFMARGRCRGHATR